MKDSNQESELLKYKERLEQTLSGTHCGTFLHDFITMSIDFDAQAQHLLGISKPQISFDGWLEIIHSDDRQRIASVIQEGLNNLKSHINITFRIIKKEKVRHLKIDSFVKYRNRKPYRTYGLVQNITKIKENEEELRKKNIELQKALSEIKTLRGIIPICVKCKKIRDDKGFWTMVEKYIEAHSDAHFSHGICQDCAEELYRDQPWYKKHKNQP